MSNYSPPNTAYNFHRTVLSDGYLDFYPLKCLLLLSPRLFPMRIRRRDAYLGYGRIL
jgi:hypothetical protein